MQDLTPPWRAMAEHAGAVRRREDPRLITGAGEFVDDLRVPGCLHAAMLRSPHAHARIRAIDVAAARRLPGSGGRLRGGGPGAGGRADADLRAAPGAAGAVQDHAAGARARALRGRAGGGGDRGRRLPGLGRARPHPRGVRAAARGGGRGGRARPRRADPPRGGRQQRGGGVAAAGGRRGRGAARPRR